MPRSDWQRRCEAAGLQFHSAPGVKWEGVFASLDLVDPYVRASPQIGPHLGLQRPDLTVLVYACVISRRYWTEDACYVLEARGADALEDAAQELHNLVLEAVAEVLEGARSDELLDRFEIPPALRAAARASWKARHADLCGRFDLLYDGTSAFRPRP